MPAGGARQEEVRQVGAGDQQYERDGAHEDHQARFHGRHHDVLERIHAGVRIRDLRKHPTKVGTNRGHIGARFFDRAVRAQPTKTQEEYVREARICASNWAGIQYSVSPSGKRKSRGMIPTTVYTRSLSDRLTERSGAVEESPR